MDIFNLKAQAKVATGKSHARRMRQEGWVPAVVYGHGENIMCQVAESDLRNLLITPYVYLVALELDGRVEKVVIKDVQYHPVSDRPLHIDFYRYEDDREIVMSIPVALTGHAVGVKAGGKLFQGIRRLKVSGLPSRFPNVIPIDVSALKVGQTLMVHDLAFDDFKVVDTQSLVVASVKSQRAMMGADEPAAEAAHESTAEAPKPAE